MYVCMYVCMYIFVAGSDALISEQPYRYLTADLMKSLRDDSLPIDVTRDDPIHRQGKIHKIACFRTSRSFYVTWCVVFD